MVQDVLRLRKPDDGWTRRQTISIAQLKCDSQKAALLLFGQLRAGLEQEAVECRVLVGEVRWRRGALEVQAADDDIEHRGHRCQLHAVKHGRHLRGDGVRVRVVVVHDYPEKQNRDQNTLVQVLLFYHHC